MTKLKSLQDVLVAELKDLMSAEKQITKALPKMIKAFGSSSLQEALSKHLQETEGQVERLNKIESIMEIKLSGEVCDGMRGLLEEGAKIIEESPASEFRDILLVTACQKVEHYEMAGYGCAKTFAEALGLDEVVELLEETLDEEQGADEILTKLSEEELLPAVQKGGADDEDESSTNSGTQRADKAQGPKSSSRGTSHTGR